MGVILQYQWVRDAAVQQDGQELGLVVIVGHAVNEEYAKEVGDGFVRLVKTFSPDDPPGKDIGAGIYDYLIGVYRPNGDNVVLGAKLSWRDSITW